MNKRSPVGGVTFSYVLIQIYPINIGYKIVLFR